MRDASAGRRCRCCGARVESGRGLVHRIGVGQPNGSRSFAIRMVEVLTCMAHYCISKKNTIAATA
jgi:hypothetical protein